jgi:hypothetical protein
LQFVLTRNPHGYEVCWLGANGQPQATAQLDALLTDHDGGIFAYAQQLFNQIGRLSVPREVTHALGKALFNGLLSSEVVRKAYRQAMEEVRRDQERGRRALVHVFLDLQAPELETLPWELMYDEESGAFLAASEHIAISRGSETHSHTTGLKGRPPLSILVLMPCPAMANIPPEGLVALGCPDSLGFKKLLDRLAERAGPRMFQYKLLHGEDANREALVEELKWGLWDALYFIGHSYYDDGRNDTFLILEDGTTRRRAAAVSGKLLREKLATSSVRLAILSSCQSIHASVSLMRDGYISATIATPDRIPMTTASVFDEGVLEALSAWRPIEDCVIHGRQRVIRWLEDNEPTWEYDDRPDWGLPALIIHDQFGIRDYAEVPDGEYELGIDESTLTKLPQWTCPVAGCRLHSKGTVRLTRFAIARWPVTNHQYRFFLEESHYDTLPTGFRRDGHEIRFLPGLLPDAPVTGVSLLDAVRYCRWEGTRLPTADEWEAAARGTDGRLFPWGDSFEPEWCHADPRASGPDSVFAREGGASPFLVEDLCGNVAEWTATGPGRANEQYCLGGSWHSLAWQMQPSVRQMRNPLMGYPDVGFRCVRSITQAPVSRLNTTFPEP